MALLYRKYFTTQWRIFSNRNDVQSSKSFLKRDRNFNTDLKLQNKINIVIKRFNIAFYWNEFTWQPQIITSCDKCRMWWVDQKMKCLLTVWVILALYYQNYITSTLSTYIYRQINVGVSYISRLFWINGEWSNIENVLFSVHYLNVNKVNQQRFS